MSRSYNYIILYLHFPGICIFSGGLLGMFTTLCTSRVSSVNVDMNVDTDPPEPERQR